MRVNFFAGPGAGKSTTTARVFSQLKERGYSVEHVGEYVKSWAYQNRSIKKWDQVYLFGKQQQYEYRFISRGVKNIVSDSPCFLSVIYALYYGENKDSKIPDAIAKLCNEYDSDFPAVNIFLNRNNKEYISEGRYETAEQARQIDSFMKGTMNIFKVKYTELDYQDKEGILETVISSIEK